MQLVAVPASSGHDEVDASAGAEHEGGAQCLTFHRAFKPLELAPCDMTSDKQLWEYDPTSREMHFSRQRSLCLDWFDTDGRWGVWTCHGAGNEQLMPDASRSGTYCALPAAGRTSTPTCVRELVGGSAGGDAPLRLRGAGRAECLEFAAPLQPLRRSSCTHTSHQLFTPHPEPAATGTGGEVAYTLRFVRDPQQCLDWFEAEAEWGLWTCDPGSKPNQLLTATRPAATARTQAQGGAAAGGSSAGAVSFCLAGAARRRVSGGCVEPPLGEEGLLLRPAREARCLRLDGSANTSLLAAAGAAAAQRAAAEGQRAVELRGATGDVAAVGLGGCGREDAALQWRYTQLVEPTRITSNDYTRHTSYAETNLRLTMLTLLARYNASSLRFYAASVPLLCLVLAADPPQLGVAPCAAAPHGAALRFEWAAASRSYCATLFSALGFDVHRCVHVGGADGGAAVAIRESRADETDGGRRGAAGASCLRAPGPFRMLEAVACAAGDTAQARASTPLLCPCARARARPHCAARPESVPCCCCRLSAMEIQRRGGYLCCSCCRWGQRPAPLPAPLPRSQELRSVDMQRRGRRALRPRRHRGRRDGFLHRRGRGKGLCGLGRRVRRITA